MFGAQTSSVLVKATSILAIAFLLSATLLASSLAYKNKKQSAIQEELQATEAAAPAPTAVTPSTPVTPEIPAASVPAPSAPTPQPVKK